jgi:hypothetical protein
MQVNKLLQVVAIGLLMALSIFAQGNLGKKQDAPSWARGTWYWTNGPDRVMTIDNDGRISLNTAGQTTYGVYYKGKIYLDGNASTITKVGNNIRTYNESTGENSDYSRSRWSGGNGNGNGGWKSGNRKENAPSWARGTWYWMNGPDRNLTIDNDGRVTLLTAGQTTYGSYWHGKIYLDGNTSTITQVGNNVRTYNESTGETSDYSHNRWRGHDGNGGGYGNGNGGSMESPPSWARGTWYWTNGPDRRMTIDSNGRITLYTAGQTTQGTYWKGLIYLDENTSTVTKIGNNIRTYNQQTGETSDYSRAVWRRN